MISTPLGSCAFRARSAVVAALAVLLALSMAGQPAQAAGTGQRRVRVEAAAAASVAAQGGRLVADYGSFQIYEVAPGAGVTADPRIELVEDSIQLHSGSLDTATAAVQGLRRPAGPFKGKRLHLVQFVGPVQPAWREELVAAGARIVDYIPNNAYLVYGDATALGRVQALAAAAPHLRWDGPYADDYKIHPAARLTDASGQPQSIVTDLFAVQLVADADANPATLQLIDQLKLEPVRRQTAVLGFVNVVARLAPGDLQTLAGQGDIVSIQPYYPRRKVCERQDQIAAGNFSGSSPTGPGYLAWLGARGFNQAQFTTSGFVVDVSDSGIDNGTTAPYHLGLRLGGTLTAASRVAYARLTGNANTGSTLKGCDGHGTLNAHIIGGYADLAGFPFADSAGYHYGLGICPFVKLGASVVFDPDYFTDPSYTSLQSLAYRDGARISNNSWGTTYNGYDIDCQEFDALVRDAQPAGATVSASGNQEMVIVFAAGNEGSAAHTVGSPGTAKNVITVGAGESVQAFGGSDGSGISDSGANNVNDIVEFSGRGPCSDGRHKPDLVAPGTHVSGGVVQVANPATTGTADACYNADGVSGGVGGTRFFPSGQQFYTASSGTSHSTPCVSGACALVRQYFLNRFTNAPSPAMTKAYLMNATRYLTGSYANDTLWSESQGMGELNLGTAFDTTPRLLRDQLAMDLFTSSGQSRAFTNAIFDPAKPLRVTLAWTDAPGSTSGNAYKNNLDLTVTVGGTTYKGNVFSGQYSVAGGSADAQNNVESVFLPAGTTGPVVVKVTAANINSDGVPNNATSIDQDFALVIYNVAGGITAAGATLTAEGFSPTNGVLDPGETVTVAFGLQNSSPANTTNLVATLQTSGGVAVAGPSQSYGVLSAGGAVATRSFTMIATNPCGSPVTATLALQDGSQDLGTVTYVLPVGQVISMVVLSQNFDNVAAPALPADWTTTASGSQASWTTASGTADSSPNAAFSSEATGIGVNELVSPAIPINSATAQLSFRNSYTLEASSQIPTTGYDGGVLEIAMGDGAFADILTAGGSFVAGGYTRTISSSYNSPLAGRQAWSGNSGGYITTTVALPRAAAGQSIRFRWRCGTDASTGGGGWHIDSITLVDGFYFCASAPVAPRIANASLLAGRLVFSFQTANGQSYTLEYSDALTNAAWLPAQSLSGDGSVRWFTNQLSAPQRFFRLRSP